ncbi:DNA/RNA helicase SEN1 [Sporobolomyces salmoneus]|uniref:DNA/RNA helicase SEN1 n=1 Tax=Sporobolomyces salmoneus TaxID=183962 RepID=UPI003174BB15
MAFAPPPSSSSSRRSGITNAAYVPPPSLIRQLEAVRDPSRVSDELVQETTESALGFLLSTRSAPSNAVIPSLKGKESAQGRDHQLVHWYCGQGGAQECWEPATFLIRLLGFKRKDEVAEWRDYFEMLMSSCPACVGSYQRAKRQCVDRYLRLYKPDKSVQNFHNGVENIERNTLLSTFVQAGFDVPTSESASQYYPSNQSSLASLPLTSVQNVLTNPLFYEDDNIVAMFTSGLPLSTPLRLPPQASPGLLAFRLHQTQLLRDFAQTQLDQSTEELSSEEYLANGINKVMESHLGVLASRDRGDVGARTGIHLYYTEGKKEFWQGMAACLRVLSKEAIRENLLNRTPSTAARLDVVKQVAGHLNDSQDAESDYLAQVCICLKILLDKLGSHFWPSDDDSYPETVLHNILGNPVYQTTLMEDPLLSAPSSNPLDTPWLDWIPSYLLSVAHSPSLFTDALALIASTFLDSLQQLRFDPSSRTRAIQTALAILSDVFISTASSSSSSSLISNDIEIIPSTPRYPHATSATKVLDLHASFLSQLAFSTSFAGPEWSQASSAAKLFLAGLLKKDSVVISKGIISLSLFSQEHHEREKKEKRRLQKVAAGDPQAKAEAEPPKLVAPKPITYSKAIWNRVYETIKDDDARAVNILLQALVPILPYEKLTSRTWAVKDLVRTQMKAINDALATARDPFVTLLMSFADERVDQLLDFLSQPGAVSSTIVLLFSPVASVHNTAQGLVKQAFDVPTRRDVFYHLAARFPDGTLQGLALAIQSFRTCARNLPEACGMAKRLVRCLSDVIDVFCDTTDGLLRNPEYVARGKDFKLQGKLLKLWELMGDALALLFRKTPDWALFFENEEMTEWMRDAILFGVDMLDQIRVFETIISGKPLDRSSVTTDSPAKSLAVTSKESKNAASMILSLANPLEELLAWLRLNDQDLLLNAFNLVRRMLGRFTRSGLELRESIVARLKKLTVKNSATSAEKRSTILRDDQLLELREALEANTVKGEARIQRGKDKVKLGTIEIDSDDDKQRPSSSSTAKSVRVKSSVNVTSGPIQSKLPFPSLPGRPPPSSSATKSKPKPKPAAPVRPKGVPWTTYSLSKKPESDSSESESSEDEDEKRAGKKLTGLALLAKDQKPAIKKTERRTIKMLDEVSSGSGRQGARAQAIGRPGIRKEDQQAARAARLRAAQDLSRLHRQILQWDPACDADEPPDVNHRSKLPGSFRNAQDYFAAFEPLLLTECWEQVRQAKIEATQEGQALFTVIAGRQSVDDFVDVFCTIEHGQMRDRIYFGDSDLVWLRQGQRQIFAKIQAVSRKRDFFELTLRCHLGKDVHDAGSGLGARTRWELLKLANLSTVHREYAALQALEWLDLCPEILNPRSPPTLDLDSRLIQSTMNACKVNEPQARAIQGSLRTDGFSLIQGPPGTGKTSTIVGLVGAFIESRPRVAVPLAVGKPTNPADVPPVPKVLLCAPSNAAVDEVAKRLKEGVRTTDGQLYVPKVVRIGADSSVDISVKEIFIDELVERATSGVKTAVNGTDSQTKMQSMRHEIEGLRLQRDEKQMEMDLVLNNDHRRGELNLELKKIKAQIFELSQRLDSEKDKAQQSRRAMDAEQRKMRIKILSEADVICSTLSGAGHDYMSQLPFDFETVIIDEAAQSIELSSLIPLKYGCTKCILVGDPLQLPPTVISSVAARGGYDRSLFVRVMQRGPQAVHLLSIQYRMHPNISAFPSTAFYQSRLTDGPNMDEKTLQTWHNNPLFPPYAFYHVSGMESAGRHHSWTNPQEAQTALAIYDRLAKEYPTVDFAYRIGIVTPYKGQVGELKKTFRQRYGEEILSRISFNTVDGFQGQEKDIIILSCVRGGSADKGVGFLADTRRMNVALTRARSSIWILGDSNKLRSNQYWSNLVGDAESRGLFRNVDLNTFRAGFSAPPTIARAIPVVKSKAKAIEMSPAYGSNAADPLLSASSTSAPSSAALPPPQIQSQASGAKKRISDAMELSTPAKKPKLDEQSTSSTVPRPGPSRLPAGKVAPAVAPIPRKKPPPSLFVPNKRPPPKR